MNQVQCLFTFTYVIYNFDVFFIAVLLTFTVWLKHTFSLLPLHEIILSSCVCVLSICMFVE